MSQLRVVTMFFSVLLLGLLLEGTAPKVAFAQDSSDARAATGGAQTLEEILRRQKSLIDGATLRPREYRAGETPPPQTAPLGPRGGTSLSDMWDQFRGGNPTELLGTPSPQQNMSTSGQTWRLLRERVLRKYLGWFPLGVIGLIVLFFLIRGQIKIREGRSGKMIPRFSMSHRIAHWFLASTFILMGISGLIILLGRPLLEPLIGNGALSVFSSAAMQGHNLFGPIFILALLIVTFRFIRGNFFQRADFAWILKGGGLLGGHASSNHYNFGEKTWYWMVVLVGLVLSVTGLFLLFPWLSENLLWHQLSTVLHAVGAILLIGVALGHAYIGSIGMEGSIDSMLRGEVDENWAKEHHDLWYEEVTGKTAGKPDDTSAPAIKEETA